MGAALGKRRKTTAEKLLGDRSLCEDGSHGKQCTNYATHVAGIIGSAAMVRLCFVHLVRWDEEGIIESTTAIWNITA